MVLIDEYSFFTRSFKRFFHCRWKLDRNKPICGVEVIFAAFINNAKIAVRRCFFVLEDAIDLVAFERGGIASIIDTDHISC